jgi:hypothetical protein
MRVDGRFVHTWLYARFISRFKKSAYTGLYRRVELLAVSGVEPLVARAYTSLERFWRASTGVTSRAAPRVPRAFITLYIRFTIIIDYQPINVPTVGAQAFLMDYPQGK